MVSGTRQVHVLALIVQVDAFGVGMLDICQRIVAANLSACSARAVIVITQLAVSGARLTWRPKHAEDGSDTN
jgi:hypothetical protein